MKNTKRKWIPEICYEDYEENNITGGLPFIPIPTGKEMPNVMFFFGSQETGEFEPDLEGNEQPIVEMEVYQYGCMKYLKENLDDDTFNKVRIALGLETLETARQKGYKLSEKVIDKVKTKLS
tara:strand:- start:4799 stop:5164 length:366 start_codon:yes stop_codon:yes gene_type:complete